MWIFGYGSLVWKAGFPYKTKLTGYIKGYLRRFYQATPDHRGTPEQPGVVPTLIPSSDPEAQVWGVVYEIEAEDEHVVAENLDYRERAGYEKQIVTFYPSHNGPSDGTNGTNKDIPLNNSTDPIEAVAYVGLQSNPYYVGHKDVEELASSIVVAKGISGSNKDYLFKLAEAMHNIAPDVTDEHLSALVEAVKKLEENSPKNINVDGKSDTRTNNVEGSNSQNTNVK